LKFVKNNKFGSLIKSPEQLVIKNGVEFLIKETAVVYLITTQSNVVVTVKDLYNNVLFSKTGGSVSIGDFGREYRSDLEVWKILGSKVQKYLLENFKFIKNLCVYFRGFSSHRSDFLKFLFEGDKPFSLI